MLKVATGTGKFALRSCKVIRFVRHGCTNRKFFHIVVQERKKDQYMDVIEQVGTYDEFANVYNERLVSLNMERIQFWLGRGALMSRPIEQLLGLAGILPIHPTSYMEAWRNRQKPENDGQVETQTESSETNLS